VPCPLLTFSCPSPDLLLTADWSPGPSPDRWPGRDSHQADLRGSELLTPRHRPRPPATSLALPPPPSPPPPATSLAPPPATSLAASSATAQDIRQSSNVSYELHRAAEIIEREPSEDDLTVKDKTDCFKLAGAIAGRVRDGEDVSITTKGPVPVLVTTKAIALAQEYVAEEGLSLSFTVQFRDLEDPSLRGSPVSTFVQFIIVREA